MLDDVDNIFVKALSGFSDDPIVHRNLDTVVLSRPLPVLKLLPLLPHTIRNLYYGLSILDDTLRNTHGANGPNLSHIVPLFPITKSFNPLVDEILLILSYHLEVVRILESLQIVVVVAYIEICTRLESTTRFELAVSAFAQCFTQMLWCLELNISHKVVV